MAVDILPGFISRPTNNERFRGLNNDERIYAHLGLCVREIIKDLYEPLYDCDFDDVEYIDILKGTSSKKSQKTGAIEYMNYMFSDQYSDEDKMTDSQGDIFAALSISRAIEKYYVMCGDWAETVCMLGRWYQEHIHTYQGDEPGVNTGNHRGRTFYECDLFKTDFTMAGTKKGVGDDCTSFCFACIQLYWDLCMNDDTIRDELLETPYPPTSIIWGDRKNAAAQNMEKYGFEILDYSPNELQPFDMVMGSINVGATHGHGEIYVGPYNGKIVEYGWGSVHDGQGNRSGMPAGTSYKENEYSLIFRMKGIKKYTEQEVADLIAKYNKDDVR